MNRQKQTKMKQLKLNKKDFISLERENEKINYQHAISIIVY